MAEGKTGDIFWGALGDAHYSIDQHTWLFSRQPRQLSVNATPLLREQEVVQYNEELTPPQEQQRRDPRKGVRKLVRSLPELQCASDVLIGELSEQYLQPIQNAVEQTFRGDLLAVQLLHSDKNYSHGGSRDEKPYLFIVCPGGSLGHRLSITIVPKRRNTYEGSSVDYFSTRHGKRYWWQNSTMEPIRQVCCSAPLEDDSILIGVRRAASVDIVMFAPSLQQHTRNEGFGASFKWRIADLQSIAHWDQDMDRNVYYMDLAFNPWDPSCLALIDSTGAWFLYQLTGPSDDIDHKLISEGLASSQQHGQSGIDANDQEPQWRKILWVCNASLLLVCSRSMLEVFDAETGQSLIRELFEASTHERNLEIADVKRNPNAADEAFIVTTVHIIWLRVRVDDDNTTQLDTIYQLPHGRDQDDVTLSMSFILGAKGNPLILYSAKVPMLEVYNFGYQNDGSSRLPVVSDPYSISYPLTLSGWDQDGSRTFRSTLTVHIQLLQDYVEYASNPDRFLSQTFILNDGFELATQIYSISQGSKLIHNSFHSASAALTHPVADAEAASRQSRASHASQPATSFVVDESEPSSEEDGESVQALSNAREVPAVDSSSGVTSGPVSWSLSNEDLYKAILKVVGHHGGPTLSTWVEQQLLALSPNSQLDLSHTQPNILELNVPNVDELTAILESVLSRLSSVPYSLNLKGIQSTQHTFGSGTGEAVRTLATVYRDVEELWGSSGPTPAGANSLQRKHLLMRYLAIELYLSNITLLPPDLQPERSPTLNLDGEQIMKNTVERLRDLAVVSEAAPVLNDAAANVLAHWELGEDPAGYDHLATSARISGSQLVNTDNASTSKRGKLARALHEQRMKQEHRHRDELRTTASQPNALHTNQDSPQVFPPGFDSSSQQPGPSSAQQGEAGQPTATGSQPVPGIYGSRKTGLAFRTAKGKGTRKAGF